jgi:hypothetical protein
MTRDVFDSGRRDLVRHLFAEIMARLEDATEIASAGQAPRATARPYRAYAQNLARIADDLDHLARAVAAITGPVQKVRARRRKTP